MPKAKITQDQLEELELKTAELRYEREKQAYEDYEAQKAAHQRRKENTQAQLKIEADNRRRTNSKCHHKQGANCHTPLKGTKESALRLVILPDGFSQMIHCPICRMKVFSPHPDDRLMALREGETEAQMQARLARFEADTLRFRELLEVIQTMDVGGDGAVLDTGTSCTFRDARTGNTIYPPRPFDVAA